MFAAPQPSEEEELTGDGAAWRAGWGGGDRRVGFRMWAYSQVIFEYECQPKRRRRTASRSCMRKRR